MDSGLYWLGLSRPLKTNWLTWSRLIACEMAMRTFALVKELVEQLVLGGEVKLHDDVTGADRQIVL